MGMLEDDLTEYSRMQKRDDKIAEYEKAMLSALKALGRNDTPWAAALLNNALGEKGLPLS